jgi:putative sterol carrier protein/Fe-S-cluster-containing hydrogenase component 2
MSLLRRAAAMAMPAMFRSRRAQGDPPPAAGRPNSNADWPFPFPSPGRWSGKKKLPANSERRQPWVAVDEIDPTQITPRFVRSSVSLPAFKAHLLERLGIDDVGVISIDHPAIAHEADEIRYVYPHCRSLIVMIGEENQAAMQSRYLPTANHELYQCEERLFAWGHEVIRHLRTLGAAGLTTTIGWPQEVSQRWADKLWPLSHKLVAQAAGLGVVGTSRNFLHHKYGAYCLIDTVLTNLEFAPEEYAESERPIDWNPCVECNLCVASCPTDAIRADGEFDFFACYNHTYRDSIPGFLDLVRDLSEAKPRRFEHRWSDSEIAALWQSLAFRVEYRCFNCVATCPAEIDAAFHADRTVRGEYLKDTLRPLTHTRRNVEQRFVIDTPSAREQHGIAPGSYRTPVDVSRPGRNGAIRLVQLQRIRVSNIDTMMRMMPYYFRPEEAGSLDFTCQFDFSGPGGGRWVLRVAEERCNVAPATAAAPDLTVRCDASLFLAIHRGEASALGALLLGKIRLAGRRRLFLAFPRIFPVTANDSIAARLAWHLRRASRKLAREPRPR